MSALPSVEARAARRGKSIPYTSELAGVKPRESQILHSRIGRTAPHAYEGLSTKLRHAQALAMMLTRITCRACGWHA
eukprot:16442232-Heterocapsa_arctica.AAC.1